MPSTPDVPIAAEIPAVNFDSLQIKSTPSGTGSNSKVLSSGTTDHSNIEKIDSFTQTDSDLNNDRLPSTPDVPNAAEIPAVNFESLQTKSTPSGTGFSPDVHQFQSSPDAAIPFIDSLQIKSTPSGTGSSQDAHQVQSSPDAVIPVIDSPQTILTPSGRGSSPDVHQVQFSPDAAIPVIDSPQTKSKSILSGSSSSPNVHHVQSTLDLSDSATDQVLNSASKIQSKKNVATTLPKAWSEFIDSSELKVKSVNPFKDRFVMSREKKQIVPKAAMKPKKVAVPKLIPKQPIKDVDDLVEWTLRHDILSYSRFGINNLIALTGDDKVVHEAVARIKKADEKIEEIDRFRDYQVSSEKYQLAVTWNWNQIRAKVIADSARFSRDEVKLNAEFLEKMDKLQSLKPSFESYMNLFIAGKRTRMEDDIWNQLMKHWSDRRKEELNKLIYGTEMKNYGLQELNNQIVNSVGRISRYVADALQMKEDSKEFKIASNLLNIYRLPLAELLVDDKFEKLQKYRFVFRREAGLNRKNY